jgi:hypothetical protein
VNTTINSATPLVRMPHRVLLALTLLWVAWGLHASSLIMCLVRFGSVPIGRVVAAAAQAFLIYLIGRGNRHARNVFALILIFLATALFFVPPSMPVSPTGAALVKLDVVAVLLLYTSAVREWFK